MADHLINPLLLSRASLNGLSPRQQPGKVTPGETDGEARAVSRQFEAMFVELLLRQARSTSQALGGEEAGMARDVYQGWFEQHVAQRITASGGIGLADSLYRSLQVRYNKENTDKRLGGPKVAESGAD